MIDGEVSIQDQSLINVMETAQVENEKLTSLRFQRPGSHLCIGINILSFSRR